MSKELSINIHKEKIIKSLHIMLAKMYKLHHQILPRTWSSRDFHIAVEFAVWNIYCRVKKVNVG